MRWASFLAAVCIAAGVAAGATSATPLPLRERVMRTSELGGLVVPGRPRNVTNIPEWTTGDPTGQWTTRDPKSLALAGFVRGLRESYGPKDYNGMSALSSVAEFRTAAGARDEVASEVGSVHPPAPTYVAFRVASIPGAHGFKKEGPGITVYSVMFSDGRFQYEIGFGGSRWAIHLHGPAIKAQMIAAAQALYRRVHGRSPVRRVTPGPLTSERLNLRACRRNDGISPSRVAETGAPRRRRKGHYRTRPKEPLSGATRPA